MRIPLDYTKVKVLGCAQVTFSPETSEISEIFVREATKSCQGVSHMIQQSAFLIQHLSLHGGHRCKHSNGSLVSTGLKERDCDIHTLRTLLSGAIRS